MRIRPTNSYLPLEGREKLIINDFGTVIMAMPYPSNRRSVQTPVRYPTYNSMKGLPTTVFHPPANDNARRNILSSSRQMARLLGRRVPVLNAAMNLLELLDKVQPGNTPMSQQESWAQNRPPTLTLDGHTFTYDSKRATYWTGLLGLPNGHPAMENTGPWTAWTAINRTGNVANNGAVGVGFVVWYGAPSAVYVANFKYIHQGVTIPASSIITNLARKPWALPGPNTNPALVPMSPGLMPWFDPFSIPVRAPANPRPAAPPYRTIPMRPKTNPWRAPGEQSEQGPAPRPKNRPSQVPSQGVRQDPGGKVQHFRGLASRKPPGPGVKEKKLIGNLHPGSAFARLLSGATEGIDLVECIHKALPKKYQAKRGARPDQKAAALWKNYKQIAVYDAAANCIWEQIKDRFYAKMGKMQGTAIRHLWQASGKRMMFGGMTRANKAGGFSNDVQT